MRAFHSSKSGVVQKRTLAALALMLLLAGLALFLASRPPRPSESVATTTPGLELSLTNLTFAAGRWHHSGTTSLFTGLAIEHYPDGTLRSRSVISNGLLQGLSEGWHTNGQLQVTEHFREGVSQGVRIKWYPGGAKLSEANIVDGQLHGTFRRWHESGALAEQAEFVAGQPEGLALAYYPSGHPKARVLTKTGTPVERQFWPDEKPKP